MRLEAPATKRVKRLGMGVRCRWIEVAANMAATHKVLTEFASQRWLGLGSEVFIVMLAHSGDIQSDRTLSLRDATKDQLSERFHNDDLA